MVEYASSARGNEVAEGGHGAGCARRRRVRAAARAVRCMESCVVCAGSVCVCGGTVCVLPSRHVGPRVVYANWQSSYAIVRINADTPDAFCSSSEGALDERLIRRGDAEMCCRRWEAQYDIHSSAPPHQRRLFRRLSATVIILCAITSRQNQHTAGAFRFSSGPCPRCSVKNKAGIVGRRGMQAACGERCGVRGRQSCRQWRACVRVAWCVV